MKQATKFLLLALSFILFSFSQGNFQIKGVVKGTNNETIDKVTITIKGVETPIKANTKGEYETSLSEGKYVIKYSAPGYASKTVIAEVVGNTEIDINLVKIQNSKTSRL